MPSPNVHQTGVVPTLATLYLKAMRKPREPTESRRDAARSGTLPHRTRLVFEPSPEPGYFLALPPGRAALAGDEHRAPETRDGADDRPAPHLVFRHEAGIEPPTQHGDIEPG